MLQQKPLLEKPFYISFHESSIVCSEYSKYHLYSQIIEIITQYVFEPCDTWDYDDSKNDENTIVSSDKRSIISRGQLDLRSTLIIENGVYVWKLRLFFGEEKYSDCFRINITDSDGPTLCFDAHDGSIEQKRIILDFTNKTRRLSAVYQKYEDITVTVCTHKPSILQVVIETFSKKTRPYYYLLPKRPVKLNPTPRLQVTLPAVDYFKNSCAIKILQSYSRVT